MDDDLISVNESNINFMDDTYTSRINTVVDTENSYIITETVFKIKEIEENIHNLSKEEIGLFKLKNNSISKLKETNDSIFTGKEDLNNFFTKLASASKLNTINLNKAESDKANDEMKKISIMKIKIKRDAALLDEKLNIKEILQDKSHLLLTEDNIVIENSNYSKHPSISSIPVIQISTSESNQVDLKNFYTFNLENKFLFSKMNEVVSKNLKTVTNDSNLNDDKFPNGDSSRNSKLKKTNQTNSASTKVSSGSSKKIKGINSYLKNSILSDKNNTNINYIIETSGNLAPKYNLNSLKLKNQNKSPNNKFNASSSIKPVSRHPTINSTTINQSKKINQNGVKNLNNLSVAGSNNGTSKSPIVKTTKFKSKQSTENFDQTEKRNPMSFIENLKIKNTVNSNTSETFSSMRSLKSKKDVLNSSMIINKKAESRNSVNSVKKSNNCNIEIDNRTTINMNINEECEYFKILLELRTIFGDELELFDEDSKSNYFINIVLFNSLDEISNKVLIKGLIKLCHFQDKFIKNYDTSLNKIKSQYKSNLFEKDISIKYLNDELSKLKLNLKGCKS